MLYVCNLWILQHVQAYPARVSSPRRKPMGWRMARRAAHSSNLDLDVRYIVLGGLNRGQHGGLTLTRCYIYTTVLSFGFNRGCVSLCFHLCTFRCRWFCFVLSVCDRWALIKHLQAYSSRVSSPRRQPVGWRVAKREAQRLGHAQHARRRPVQGSLYRRRARSRSRG